MLHSLLLLLPPFPSSLSLSLPPKAGLFLIWRQLPIIASSFHPPLSFPVLHFPIFYNPPPSPSGRPFPFKLLCAGLSTQLLSSIASSAPEKKVMWRREMECLLSACDYIVEFYPSVQNLKDGTTLEVMETRPRSDLYINLPALEKLDTMLLEILESFEKTEFWYVDDGDRSPCANISRSFRRMAKRNEEKWWRPIPCLPTYGLTAKCRKDLQQKRDCANQIHKAAMAINGGVLAEMEVPDSYIAALPKSGRAGIGDAIYRSLSSEQFSPDYALDCIDISTDHEAVEAADRIEASMYVWQRRSNHSGAASKSSWDMVKEFMQDADKNAMLTSRAHSLLLSLKQRYPGLSQTTLDSMKIQYNSDVGQAILESYSRVLESLAFNLVSFVDDVLYIDESIKKR